jgi:hypothetical protein
MEQTVIINNKIKDNKAIIQNKLNRRLFAKGERYNLFNESDIEKMVFNKMKELKCSELEASEIVKKEIQ